jgi:signal transduction histidine kinase
VFWPMNLFKSRWWKGLLRTPQPEPQQQAERIVAMQLHIVLPAKAGLIAVVLYSYLDFGGSLQGQTTYGLVVEMLRWIFFIFVAANAVAGVVFSCWRRFPPSVFQWIVFTLGILDGLFVAGLAFLTDGFESMAYWLFPALIVLNAISIPLATPQIVLNLLFSVFYLTAGVLNAEIQQPELTTPSGRYHVRPTRGAELPYSTPAGENAIEPDLSRLFMLWLLAVCAYGVQVLLERQRLAIEEARESAARESQLHSAGRLAAEFAHQIKNPLAVINNAAFSLQRSRRDGKAGATRQIEIIQEEVERADRVITQIMGYAQLSEGRVEKLDVTEELERAIAQVFPPAVPTSIRVHRDYARHFPPLLMQRGHLSEIFVNLLQNARDAIGGKGNVFVAATCHRDYSIEISVRDDGAGIPPDKTERIFEAYYTTKEKGTGLGLAIVKHNVELYGGTVRVESEAGKGARFVLTFPAKALMSLHQ